jgi:hypothetical protein
MTFGDNNNAITIVGPHNVINGRTKPPTDGNRIKQPELIRRGDDHLTAVQIIAEDLRQDVNRVPLPTHCRSTFWKKKPGRTIAAAKKKATTAPPGKRGSW